MKNGEVMLWMLLGIAAVVLNAAAFVLPLAVGCGVIAGEVVLATAATVLQKRHLWLRLTVLAIVLVTATGWIGTRLGFPALGSLFVATSGMLVAAASMAGLRFLGWRVTHIAGSMSETPHALKPEPAGQFSLATLMLVTVLIALFLGVSRAFDGTWELAMWGLAIGIFFALPGSILLLAAAHSRWALLASVALVWPIVLGIGAFMMREPILMVVIGHIAMAIGCELTFLAGVIVTLRVAGFGLSRTMPEISGPSRAVSSRPAELLA